MPVAEMKKIYISALIKDKQKLVEYLQRQEVIELGEDGSHQSHIFSPTDSTPDIADAHAKYLRAKKAMDILDAYASEKTSMFAAMEGKTVKTVSEYERFQKSSGEVLHIVENVCGTEDKIRRIQDESIRLNEKKESLQPWTSLQTPLSFTGTKHTVALIGTLPQGYTPEELETALETLEADCDQFVFHIISSFEEQTCLMAISMKNRRKELESVLGRLQFSPPPVMTDNVPRAELESLDARIKENNALLETLREEISRLAKHKQEIRFLLDYLNIMQEEHKAFGQINQAGYTFLLTGYIPSKELDRVKDGLEKRFRCVVQSDEVSSEDDVPSLMENSWFSEPLEGVVASYNYPKYKETDPTKITSFFYYFMFGLMFSDACYGAILALSCGILLLKFKNMQAGTSKFLRLFFWCGISTLAWGIVFSSYFGDVVDVFSSTFMGQKLSIPPLWFAPLEEPMRLLIFCLAIGIVHLTVGYGANMYAALRNRDIAGAVFDSVMPVALLFSLLVVFMGTEMFQGLAGFSLTISAAAGHICLAIAGACAAGILLTSGRESKNWVKRLLKGAFGLYNVLAGWVSDILSYSRLLALGLATGVIGSVINTLAAMPGKGIVGIIAFIIIFAAGHLMNFGINILGSYVHSNRLEYVEFFGKFYEGGGRKFCPLGLNTKYYTIREEN